MQEKTKGTSESFLSIQRAAFFAAAIIISGTCWYLANSLSGNFGFLMWGAPLPVLLFSYYASAKTSFIAAFIAYFIGRLSWFHYLLAIISLVPTLLFLLSFSFVFALIIIINRRILLSLHAWYNVFTFPVLLTLFEWVLLKFSPDGTVTSIACSQMNFLPVIQIAAVTGILGITFLLTLVPAAVALGWQYRGNKKVWIPATVLTSIVLVATFLFGVLQLVRRTQPDTLKAGMAVLDEKYHHFTDHPDLNEEAVTAAQYAATISELAREGAKLVLLPERAINLNKETAAKILPLLARTARENKVAIVFGFTNMMGDTSRNSAMAISSSGDFIDQYNKVHLVKGLEDRFLPGNTPCLFIHNNRTAGLAICKDMDFPLYIQQYHNIGFMTVPAWDFSVDSWYHARMAILRGVENGYSVIRAARQGRLTISDCYGRLSTEVDCSKGNPAKIIGDISLHQEKTWFARWGDWFGITNAVAAVCCLFLWAKTRYF